MGSERVMLGIAERQKEKKGTLAFSKVLTCPQGRVPLSFTFRVFAQFWHPPNICSSQHREMQSATGQILKLSKSQKIRNAICWDVLQSATSNHKLLVIHAYLSVLDEMQLHRQVWIAAQQTRWDCSVSSVGFKLPWLPEQMILNDKFTFLKTDATMDSFFQV